MRNEAQDRDQAFIGNGSFYRTIAIYMANGDSSTSVSDLGHCANRVFVGLFLMVHGLIYSPVTLTENPTPHSLATLSPHLDLRGGGARGDLAVSRVLSRRERAHLPYPSQGAPPPPILFGQIWSRVRGGPGVEYKEEARRRWADLAGAGLIRPALGGSGRRLSFSASSPARSVPG